MGSLVVKYVWCIMHVVSRGNNMNFKYQESFAIDISLYRFSF